MSGITLQDIFDKAWQHFIVEDNPPAMVGNLCRYLTPEGRKCAIGLTLPEGHSAQISPGPFSLLVKNFPELWNLELQEMDEGVLNYFQTELHDGFVEDGFWTIDQEKRERQYRKVAKEHNLKIPGET